MANHFDLPGLQSIFGIPQDTPMYVHASLNQYGFYWEGVWVEHPLTWLPFGLQGVFSVPVWSGSLLILRTRNMWSWQGPDSSFNCPAILCALRHYRCGAHGAEVEVGAQLWPKYLRSGDSHWFEVYTSTDPKSLHWNGRYCPIDWLPFRANKTLIRWSCLQGRLAILPVKEVDLDQSGPITIMPFSWAETNLWCNSGLWGMRKSWGRGPV